MGITVHPRPDERHIRYDDVIQLAGVVTTELNVEGYPSERFLRLIEAVKPAQATLVPDPPDALTSDAGWNTVDQRGFLVDIIQQLKATGARVSIFVDPDEAMIEGAAAVATDRIELYTEGYARRYAEDREASVTPYAQSAERAHALGLGVNAGHDLDLKNLRFFKERVPHLLEVSIGHALICDALYYGLENTIQMYRRTLV